MKRDDVLPAMPPIDVQIVRDATAEVPNDKAFLRARRMVLRNRRPDGSLSAEYRYDFVERNAMDAVAILLTSGQGASKRVCLRSSVRPPLKFRSEYSLAIAEPNASPLLWEIPAGLIEVDEKGEDGIRECAARETLEEVGVAAPPSAFSFLGVAVVLSPGVIGEKIHFLHAHIDASERGVPTEDGSPLEADAAVCFVTLAQAAQLLRDGRIDDAKTEIGLRRLLEREAAL